MSMETSFASLASEIVERLEGADCDARVLSVKGGCEILVAGPVMGSIVVEPIRVAPGYQVAYIGGPGHVSLLAQIVDEDTLG